MPRWSVEEYNRFVGRGPGPEPSSSQRPEASAPESALHNFIIQECKRRGWVYFHGSMAHKTSRTLGEPDFEILTQGGGLLLIECKAGKKKRSEDQRILAHLAKALGHTIHLIRTQQEFRNLVTAHEDQIKERVHASPGV